MKKQICVLTLLISLRIENVLCSNTITDCEINENEKVQYYDHSYRIHTYRYQKSVTLFCGRSAERCNRYNHNYNYNYNYNYKSPCSDSCYDQIFTNGESSDVRTLKTGDCRGNRLNKIICEKFNDITVLDISNHGIEYLSSSDLNFRELNILNAEHNHLVNISDSLFINTPTITQINFSHNNITTIHPDAFRNASAIYSVDLSGNSIERLDKDTFKNNTNLQVLKLGDNPIQRIDEKIFSFISQFTSLKLYLSCPNIYELDATSCTQFNSDYYSFNRLLSLRCSSNIDTYLACDGSNFISLKYFNISGNQLGNVDHLLNGLVSSSIETLDLSSNYLGALNANSFSKFENLKYLDVRNTRLSFIDFPFAQYNKKLEVFRLESNPIKRFDCNIFALIAKSTPITISSDNVSEIDTSCLRNSIEIIELNNGNEIAVRSLQTKSELRHKKINFQQLTSFNVSGNQLQNTPMLFDLLAPTLETLDVSFNYVGKITAQTFERFTNLKFLNLSHTELSNFQFSTFYHQRRLKMLDISYNHLGSVNFTLFLRIFKDLETLNLEGNNLIEVDSVTRLIFPNLGWLGISKNHFNCDYLRNFLPQWNHISLLDNPSANQTHIDGTDCDHGAGQKPKATETETTTRKPVLEPEVTHRRDNFYATTEKPTIEVLPDPKTDIGIGLTTRFDCNAFFDGNLSISCDEIREIDLSCQKSLIKVIVNNESGLTFHDQSQSNSTRRSRNEFHCSNKDLQYIKYLNISGNQLENAPQLIESLGSSIETLDLSSNFVGKLNVSTFQRFNRLEYLNLSHTNLSNFEFNTFYHQTKLKVLDISYNHLKAVNFTLFLRNFKNLRILNLEGNNLMQIDTVTRLNFPKLIQLGASKNNFSCDYLTSFLRQWDNLQLMHNPTNDTHIDGTDCYTSKASPVEDESNKMRNVSIRFENATTGQQSAIKAVKSELKQSKEFDKSTESPKVPDSHLSADVQILKYLVMGICVIWCLNFVIKNKWIRQKLNRNALERIVTYQPQREHDMQQSIELIENGSVKE